MCVIKFDNLVLVCTLCIMDFIIQMRYILFYFFLENKISSIFPKQFIQYSIFSLKLIKLIKTFFNTFINNWLKCLISGIIIFGHDQITII